MTRLDKIIKAFNDYDNLVEELALRNSDNSQSNAFIPDAIQNLMAYEDMFEDMYRNDGDWI